MLQRLENVEFRNIPEVIAILLTITHGKKILLKIENNNVGQHSC